MRFVNEFTSSSLDMRYPKQKYNAGSDYQNLGPASFEANIRREWSARDSHTRDSHARGAHVLEKKGVFGNA